jgi:hypothetical protein
MQRAIATSAPDPDLLAAFGFDSPDVDGVSDTVTGRRAIVRQATWTEAGRFGGALAFDGRNSEVVADLFPRLTLRRAMTIEAWVKPSDRQRGSSTIVADDGGAFALRASSHDQMRAPLMMVKLGQHMREARLRTPIPAHTWTHLAAVYDGRSITVYIDARPSVRLMHWSTHHPLRTSLDGLNLDPGLVASPAEVLAILSGHFTLAITLQCGAPESESAPVFSLVGVQSLQVLNVNASGQELQVGWLSRARLMGLAPIEYRAPQGLAGCASGQTREITVKGPVANLQLFDQSGDTLVAEGPGVGSAWAFFFDSRLLPVWAIRVVSVGYLALLAVPLGFWARRSWASLGGLLLVGTVVAFGSDAVGGHPIETADVIGLIVGAILGAITSALSAPSHVSRS